MIEMSVMTLKLYIKRARLKGVPVYCIILLLMMYVAVKLYDHQTGIDLVPRHLRKYLKFSKNYIVPTPKLSPQELNALTDTIELINYEREVFNQQRFGLVHPDTTVILVQVHRDAERLQYLIVSLAQVHYIQSTVIIFSHSFYDERINKMIMSITFCRFMQIFYPFSNQLNPNKFPGIDPEDCISSQTTPQRDKYCSDRDARLVEHKHHWWWKAYFVFTRLDWSPKYKGTVIFLEEDNYVLPDLLHMLRYTKRSLSAIPGLHVMAFGKPLAKDLEYDILTVDSWRPPYDKGLAFNKTVWKKITSLASFYCTYDDLSWSYSMLNLFSNFLAGHTDMVACMAPRVLSTSMFASGKAAIEKIQSHVQDAPLFPAHVKAAMVYTSSGRIQSSAFSHPPKGNGGWSDIRDHLLCLDPFASSERTSTASDETTTTSPTYSSLLQFNYSAQIITTDETRAY